MGDEKITKINNSSSNNRWSWDVSGFERRNSSDKDDDYYKPASVAPLVRRYSISTTSEVQPKRSLVLKLNKLNDKLKLAREDHLELRQEANDLQEYCNAKLDRVTRYLGVLANKTRKLDQVALETEARISPLINEKKRLFNELLTARGSIKVFCRTRPLFEDEGPAVVEFPDDYTIRINTGDETASNPKKDFEFDRVYGPHVGQSEVFNDVQPFVQSALDGYNVSLFAYGQTGSGKTHTMEGSNYDRGLYVRCFEELFDLSNSDTTLTCRYNFFVTVIELFHIDQSCAQRQIADARHKVEMVAEEDAPLEETSQTHVSHLGSGSQTEIDVTQWNVLQFNTGSTSSFIIKCGANSNFELVIKADSKVQEPKGSEIVRVVPRPTILENMSLEDIKQVFSQLPEAPSLLALARTADGTRARYSRLYRTLAMKVPSLRNLVAELERDGALKDVRS